MAEIPFGVLSYRSFLLKNSYARNSHKIKCARKTYAYLDPFQPNRVASVNVRDWRWGFLFPRFGKGSAIAEYRFR